MTFCHLLVFLFFLFFSPLYLPILRCVYNNKVGNESGRTGGQSTHQSRAEPIARDVPVKGRTTPIASRPTATRYPVAKVKKQDDLPPPHDDDSLVAAPPAFANKPPFALIVRALLLYISLSVSSLFTGRQGINKSCLVAKGETPFINLT